MTGPLRRFLVEYRVEAIQTVIVEASSEVEAKRVVHDNTVDRDDVEFRVVNRKRPHHAEPMGEPNDWSY